MQGENGKVDLFGHMTTVRGRGAHVRAVAVGRT